MSQAPLLNPDEESNFNAHKRPRVGETANNEMRRSGEMRFISV